MNKENNLASKDNELRSEYYPTEALDEQEIKELEEKLDNKIEKNKSRLNFIHHLQALKKYLFDKNVRWYRKSIVVAAILYFITPIDTIPDISPIIGFLDDLGVIAWTIKFLGDEIEHYY